MGRERRGAVFSPFLIFSFLAVSVNIVLGNKKVHAYHVPSRKKQAQRGEIISKTSNFKEAERAKFPSRIRTIVSRKFLRIMIAVSEISHVADGRVCYS